MKSLHHVKCSPSGNLTVLIFSKVPRARQPDIAKQIMKQQPDVEQVGFVEKPNSSKAITRLQMMGGEFCGNATCALGWILSRKTGFQNGAIEVSGAKKPVHVSISNDGVEVEMPIKHDLNSVKHLIDKAIVELEGITHVILNQPPPSNIHAEAYKLLSELSLTNLEAAGVLYIEPYENNVFMTPIVWVRSTNTLVKENSCASGSVCVAMWQASVSRENLANFQVHQPSGSVINATVEIDNGVFTKASITGKVEILEEGEFTLHADR